MIYDVAIIGAGIIGAMTAYYLSKYELNIAIIEEKDDVGAGITKANSAIVHAGYDAECLSLKAKMNVRGCEMMPGICKALGVPYKNCTSNVVAFSESEVQILKALLARGIQNGVKNLEIISSEKLREIEPNVSKAAKASLWAKDAGIVSPYSLALAAIQNSVTNGSKLFLEHKVTKIEEKGGIIEITAQDKVICAHFAVNAAGLYSDTIASLMGDTVPEITPRRGEYYLLDKNTKVKVNSVLFSCPNENGKGILVSPTVHGNLICGPNAERVYDKNDTSTTRKGLDDVKIGAIKLVPDIKLNDAITEFSGLRPTPSGKDFYIHTSEKIKNAINAVGIESPGLASSPAIGEYISQMLFYLGLKNIKRKNYIPSATKNGNIKMFSEMNEQEKALALANDSSYGKIVCRCETVTMGDIKAILNAPVPARSIDAVKRRTRAGMGRCQGGFCQPSVAKLIASHFGMPLESVTKCGGNSYLLSEKSPKGGDG